MSSTKVADVVRHGTAPATGFAVLAALLLSLASSVAFGLPPLEIESLSNRPDKLSGGDALVRIVLPGGVVPAAVSVELNGVDVTGLFQPESNGQALSGLLDGLQIGKNVLIARAEGAKTRRFRLVNFPIEGPVFSGPREQPFFCETELFSLYPEGPTLGSALDQNCSIARSVDYVDMAEDGSFKGLPDPLVTPADLVTTVTTEGATVPYIVRVETGTINRAVYQTAVLDDPSVPGPDLINLDPGWNERLVYLFGGGCPGGWYRQGSSTGGVPADRMLSQGFATASASLNVFGNNCNDLLAAETMMMVKERFIEAYGVPGYTIGWGCSGGSYQVHQIGDNYPGLLDGIVPQCSFPDVGFGTTHTVADARLLEHYFEVNSAVPWTQEEMRAVSGFGVFNSIGWSSDSAGRIDPVPDRPDGRNSAAFNSVVPDDVRYHPVSNRGGARATVYDHTINAYGRDKKTGFARRPLDNIGIQYGLVALNAGEITLEQFLDLNGKIGGFDIDANFVPWRMAASWSAIRAAYRTGRMLNGGAGLAEMPILDYDLLYTDLQSFGDHHMKFQHFSTRERLLKANGHVDNHVMWSGGGDYLQVYAVGAPWVDAILDQALTQMDQWLANIEADTSGDPREDKVVRNKPTDLVDGCWSQTEDPEFFPETQTFGGVGSSFCNDLYPAFPFPRMIAGGPLANDIIKCRRKPIDPADYPMPLSKAELARLRAAFRTGVCDWSKRGVAQLPLVSTWVSFPDVGRFRRDRPRRR